MQEKKFKENIGKELFLKYEYWLLTRKKWERPVECQMMINLIIENRFVEEKVKSRKDFKVLKHKMRLKYDRRCVLEKSL